MKSLLSLALATAAVALFAANVHADDLVLDEINKPLALRDEPPEAKKKDKGEANQKIENADLGKQPQNWLEARVGPGRE